jgi:hypothetical protein
MSVETEASIAAAIDAAEDVRDPLEGLVEKPQLILVRPSCPRCWNGWRR